jgi:hypothetical protein
LGPFNSPCIVVGLHYCQLQQQAVDQYFTMDKALITGNVSFVNHEKKYIIIEYEQSGKKKTVNANIDEKQQGQLNAGKKINKSRLFHIGDTVSFNIKISDRGDRMIATNIQFLYNTALDVLLNKARTENNFIGYLKIVDDKYFVKEIDSYLFFPLPVSPWQIDPTEKELNEAVTFSLENTEKKDKITAKLYNNNYIPEFYTAVKLHKANTPINAEVYKITPHGIYLNVIGDKIQSKLPIPQNNMANPKVGDKIKVLITYLSTSRIIVEPVT